MMQPGRFYISHSAAHAGHYYRLERLLAVPPVDGRFARLSNASFAPTPLLYWLDREPPLRLMGGLIRRRLTGCRLLIVLLGDYFDADGRMALEARTAAELDLPVLGIIPEDGPRAATRPPGARYRETDWDWGNIHRLLEDMLQGPVGGRGLSRGAVCGILEKTHTEESHGRHI